MKKIFSKTRENIEIAMLKTKMNAMDAFSKNTLSKDNGDATIIVVIAIILLALLLVAIFKDTIFEKIKKAMENLGGQMDSIFNLTP